MRLHLIILSLFAVIISQFAIAQEKGGRPSPAANAQCSFADGKTVHVDYSSPRARGRKVYGGLVPYDQVWRTGANEATTFVTNTDVTVDDTTVPAGNYTLFTVPSQGTWKLVVSKKTGEWGIPYPGEGSDLARVDMKTEKLPQPVENFTIAFDKTGPDSCRMRVDWETTRAYVDIKEKK